MLRRAEPFNSLALFFNVLDMLWLVLGKQELEKFKKTSFQFTPSTNFSPRLWYPHGGGDTMPREYLILVNAILDALDVLIKGLQDAEEEVIK
jgi:hypothetical protein